ncbi:unnamed protein product [Cuscuta europaea]|uniref:Uncharacterized protein n=1 Tax=Cuscuta europaea TaxID=41803 RepID=A0A9P1DXU8_CUSEU|nr:unnamed protein product [Cuscuta europaea]
MLPPPCSTYLHTRNLESMTSPFTGALQRKPPSLILPTCRQTTLNKGQTFYITLQTICCNTYVDRQTIFTLHTTQIECQTTFFTYRQLQINFKEFISHYRQIKWNVRQLFSLHRELQTNFQHLERDITKVITRIIKYICKIRRCAYIQLLYVLKQINLSVKIDILCKTLPIMKPC